jgi:hypothetical protein
MVDAEPTELRLVGELTTPPSELVAVVLLAISGVAFVRGALRVAGRLAFGFRRPAELRLSERGLEVSHRTELLGRVLLDSETLIPLSNLSSVTREVRHARLGLYAGLIALVGGTYVGVGLLVDGVRVPGGSPSLLGLGLGAIALGIVLDFALAVVVDTARKTCRVVVTPRHGRRLCVQGLDPAAADRVLARLAESVGAASATGATSAPAPSA